MSGMERERSGMERERSGMEWSVNGKFVNVKMILCFNCICGKPLLVYYMWKTIISLFFYMWKSIVSLFVICGKPLLVYLLYV